jgi:hypothetical protein
MMPMRPKRASQTQLANLTARVRQLTKDFRIKLVYSANGHSSGCVLGCEVPAQQDVLQLADSFQRNGLPPVQIIQLMGFEQLQASLQLAQQFAVESSGCDKHPRAGTLHFLTG